MNGFDINNIPSEITNSIKKGSESGKLKQPPILTEITKINEINNDNTPSYTFYSTKVGIIKYGGSCKSDTVVAYADNMTIDFSKLGDEIYNDCTITVTDNLNQSYTLKVSNFSVDTNPPKVLSVTSDNDDGFYFNT